MSSCPLLCLIPASGVEGCFPEMIPQEVEASWATFLPVRKFFLMNCKSGGAWCSTVLRKEKEAFRSSDLVSESALATLMASLLNQFGRSQHQQTFLVLSFVVTNFVWQEFLFCFVFSPSVLAFLLQNYIHLGEVNWTERNISSNTKKLTFVLSILFFLGLFGILLRAGKKAFLGFYTPASHPSSDRYTNPCTEMRPPSHPRGGFPNTA